MQVLARFESFQQIQLGDGLDVRRLALMALEAELDTTEVHLLLAYLSDVPGQGAYLKPVSLKWQL